MRSTLTICFLSVAFLQLQAQEDPLQDYYIFSIYFGGGNYYITPDQEEELYKWLEGIPGVENHQISVHSHTDNIGSREYNAWLSQMRSESAIEKLLNHGIDPAHISIEDFGELNPVYDNSTWEGRLKNRRVDIIVKPLVI